MKIYQSRLLQTKLKNCSFKDIKVEVRETQAKPFFLFEWHRQGLRQGEQKVGHQYLGDPAQKKVFILHSFSFLLWACHIFEWTKLI